MNLRRAVIFWTVLCFILVCMGTCMSEFTRKPPVHNGYETSTETSGWGVGIGGYSVSDVETSVGYSVRDVETGVRVTTEDIISYEDQYVTVDR
jgi:hypothetical protein